MTLSKAIEIVRMYIIRRKHYDMSEDEIAAFDRLVNLAEDINELFADEFFEIINDLGLWKSEDRR